MNPIKPGVWQVQQVEVNSMPADEAGEFNFLISTPETLRLDPAGIVFKFSQATGRSAVLESQAQIFFADFGIRGDRLTINLSRPAFSERITIVATFETGALDSPIAESA